MISIVRLIDALGITDEADVLALSRWRDAALGYIETQTRRYFGAIVTNAEYVKGTGTRSLWLSHIPQVGGVYTTTVLEYAYPGATGTAVAITTGFVQRVHGHEVELLRSGSSGVWTFGYDYLISYSKGYAEDAATNHKDIEDLIIELVRLKWNAGGDEVMKSESVGGYSYTRFDDVTLSEDAGKTIASWQRPVFA